MSRLGTFLFAATGIVFLSLWFRADAPRAFAGVNDFMGMYAGGRLAGTPEQFEPDAHIREQVRATGWAAPSILYTRLPAFAILFRPLGRMEYRRAYALWQALSLTALAVFLAVWPAPNRRLLLCAACWSFPLFAVVAGGQDLIFLLLILAVVWRFGQSRPLLAGVLLPLMALKFHLVLLLPILLIAQRRWRMLSGAAVASGAILGACFAVAGAAWPTAYARFILQEQTNPNVRRMPNLHALLEGLPHQLGWEIALAIAVAVAVGWVAHRTSFPVGLSAALVGSLLVSHHAYPADALLLLPALLTLAAEIAVIPVRLVCAFLLSPLPFLVTPRVPLASPAVLASIGLLAGIAVFAGRGLSGDGTDGAWNRAARREEGERAAAS